MNRIVRRSISYKIEQHGTEWYIDVLISGIRLLFPAGETKPEISGSVAVVLEYESNPNAKP